MLLIKKQLQATINLTYVWEVWLDEIFDKYPSAQLSKSEYVRGNICFSFNRVTIIFTVLSSLDFLSELIDFYYPLQII